jgi:hypothetical protein
MLGTYASTSPATGVFGPDLGRRPAVTRATGSVPSGTVGPRSPRAGGGRSDRRGRGGGVRHGRQRQRLRGPRTPTPPLRGHRGSRNSRSEAGDRLTRSATMPSRPMRRSPRPPTGQPSHPGSVRRWRMRGRRTAMRATRMLTVVFSRCSLVGVGWCACGEGAGARVGAMGRLRSLILSGVTLARAPWSRSSPTRASTTTIRRACSSGGRWSDERSSTTDGEGVPRAASSAPKSVSAVTMVRSALTAASRSRHHRISPGPTSVTWATSWPACWSKPRHPR